MRNIQHLSNALRALTMDAVQEAASGHPGMPLGMADVATVLFRDFLVFDPRHPDWPNRDRFVLSAGHGSMLLYALLYLTGYGGLGIQDLKQFRKLHSKTPGHPEYGHTPGVETTTGPLGQGLANAVGMALAERLLRAEFGAEIAAHFTYVVVGDGCLMEGLGQEAMSFAGHQKLEKLIVLFDDNRITIDGPTSLSTSDDHAAHFESLGFHVQGIDGHDPKAIHNALLAARAAPQPSFIACRTLIGYGAPNKQGTEKAHGSPLGLEEIKLTKEKLDWPYGPFDVPQDILEAWRTLGTRCHDTQEAWQKNLKKHTLRTVFEERMKDHVSKEAFARVAAAVAKMPLVPESTRKASEIVLSALISQIPALVGGSADLTPSNNTFVKGMQAMTPETPCGHYIHYGIREHAMGGIMNGLALHGGVIPYGGTFLTFSDYMRPAIRLSALMGLRVIYVMTHDSIGLGEDGPTHQPIEHLMSLRLIPNLLVMRPADLVETYECWRFALEHTGGPSLLALSRQTLSPQQPFRSENLTMRGGYIYREAKKPRLTLIATGSEVSLALDVQADLETKGIPARVVSMPVPELFAAQTKSYRDEILGPCPRVVIEAGVPWGWEKYVGPEPLVFGIETFGASAPAPDLYDFFGLTAPKISPVIEKYLKERE